MEATKVAPELCHCGQALHYTDLTLKATIDDLVEQLGKNIEVTVVHDGGRHAYLVPRHYIALHGIKGKNVAELGFRETATK